MTCAHRRGAAGRRARHRGLGLERGKGGLQVPGEAGELRHLGAEGAEILGDGGWVQFQGVPVVHLDVHAAFVECRDGTPSAILPA